MAIYFQRSGHTHTIPTATATDKTLRTATAPAIAPATATAPAPATATAVLLSLVATAIFIISLPHTAIGADTPRFSGTSLALVINQNPLTYKDIADMGFDLTSQNGGAFGAGSGFVDKSLASNETLRESIVEGEILTKALKQVRLPEPTPEDQNTYIQAILDAQGATREQLLQDLKASGLSYDSYLARINLELKRQSIAQNVIAPTIVITSRDILEYGFGEYKEAKPYVINVIYDPKYDTQITDLFRDGLRDQELAALSRVAQAVVIPYDKIGDIRDDLQPIVKTLKAKTISPVRVVDGSAYRFYITSNPRTIASFYDLNGRILQELYASKLQATYDQWLEMQMRFSIVQVFE